MNEDEDDEDEDEDDEDEDEDDEKEAFPNPPGHSIARARTLCHSLEAPWH